MTFETRQVNGNPLDPLKQGERGSRELFDRFSRAANGFEHDAVVGAAANLLLNAIRQQCPTAKEAEFLFDEFMARSKAVLLDQHYFPNGKRRSVFPFHQVIRPAFVLDPDKMP